VAVLWQRGTPLFVPRSGALVTKLVEASCGWATGGKQTIVLLGLNPAGERVGSTQTRLPDSAWVNSPAHTNAAPPAFASVTWTLNYLATSRKTCA
jgi:hypothetical protein